MKKQLFKPQADNIEAQSGVMPMLYSQIDNFPLDCINFLLETRPDAVILCINPHDRLDDIKRTASGIEALGKRKVTACSLFPLGYTNEWDILSGAKRAIERNALLAFKAAVEEALYWRQNVNRPVMRNSSSNLLKLLTNSCYAGRKNGKNWSSNGR
ncbi:MAG: hypothetical protein LBF87_09300 [Treponema sp.]|jgi:hypothetical protein|nr:hypothetical protein [Treponema sp.]